MDHKIGSKTFKFASLLKAACVSQLLESFKTFSVMRKRALAELQQDEESHDGISSARQGAGEKLRQLLLDRFVMGLLPGSDVAELCHWITKAGGVGVQDLALKPELAKRHGSEHVTLHAGKVFPDRDLTYIDVPLYQKREARRTSEKIPIMLPSKLLEKFVFKDYKKDDVNLAKYLQGLPCYEQHPVVRRARANRESEIVRPLALYWDGVRYSVHDSFTGFYITDILSGQKFLSFLLRSSDFL